MRFYRFKATAHLLKAKASVSPSFRGDAYIEKLKALRAAAKSEGKKVVIIGAGIAGLSAGSELKKLGYEVEILEAQTDHIGGRLRTLRKDGRHAELGAMRIPASHTLTRFFIHECDLTLRPFVQDNPNTYCHLRNTTFKRNNEQIQLSKSFFQLSEEEQNKNLTELWEQAVLHIVDSLSEAEIADLFSVSPVTEKVKSLDGKSLHDAFIEAGLSEEAGEYVLTHFGLETYLQTSLAEHIREEIEQTWNPDGFAEIATGTDSLASKIYEALKAETKTGARVFKLEQDADKAYVYYRNAAGEEVKVAADWVICTAPLGLVAKMDIAKAFSPQKIRAIRRVNYDSSTKVLAVTRNRFWEQKEGIYGGGTIYDGPAGHTWYPSDNSVKKDPEKSAAPSFLLASYTWGQLARRVDAIEETELKPFVLGELQKVHSYVQEEDITALLRWSWTEFPWSAGAFAFFNPGEHQFLYHELKKPEARIMLAGEHCSLTHSWIQGSLESSIDVCTHIIANA